MGLSGIPLHIYPPSYKGLDRLIECAIRGSLLLLATKALIVARTVEYIEKAIKASL